MKKPEPNFGLAIFNQLYRLLFSVEHGPCMEDKLDNEKVGLPVMTAEQARDVVKACMA